jgi:LPXTG-motif cell wall-anchored protein
MTLHSPGSPKRGSARFGAILAAAAFGAALAATPAQAQTGFDIDAAAWPDGDSFYVGWTEETQRQSGEFYAIVNADKAFDGVQVVFGLSDDLGGLALETEQEGCVATGITITCDYTETSEWVEVRAAFDLLVPQSVRAFDEVDYSISVQPAGAEEATVFGGTWEFLPTGDEYARYELFGSSFEGVAPGGTVTPQIAFRNANVGTYNDVYLAIGQEHPYLQAAANYSNCGFNEWGETMCVFEGLAPEPGVIYELAADTPITVTLDEHAPGPMEYFQYFGVEAFDVWNRDEIENLDYFEADTELVFEVSDLEDIEDNGGTTVTSAANPYDLAIEAGDIDAATGETAVIDISAENLGPADAIAHAHPGSGEGSFVFAVQLPAGVELDADQDENGYFTTPGDDHCHNAALNEWLADDDPADYRLDRLDVVCSVFGDIEAGAVLTVDLPVKVTGAAGADGRASIIDHSETWTDAELEYWDLTEADFPVLDSDLDNNTAAISRGGDGSGQLPSTGASLTVIGGTAAAALAAGVVVFVLMRRRKTAAQW